MSELAKMLMVGFYLLAGEQGTGEMMNLVGVSRATLGRYIDELRNMGCVIESVSTGSGYVYRLGNAHAVEDRLCRWLDLELSRKLI